MKNDTLTDLIARITPLDTGAMQSARLRQGRLTKPAGSLGLLEELSIQVAGITGDPRPRLQHKLALVMAGDHGVAAEGVSAYPQAVTQQMVYNFLNGGAAVNVLARHVGVRLQIVDMGVAADLQPHPNLLVRKIAYGTQNIALGPAMSRAQAIQSLLAGAEVFEAQLAQGADILATGDMGIGNTTPSAAIAAAFTGRPVPEITGRGTGIDNAGFQRKITAIQRALEANQPDPADGLDVLARVGGFEIGGLAGAILAAAANSRPVVIDGYISTAAAMIAASLAPQVRHYLIAAHSSLERGHHLMLNWLQARPLLDLQMRLGEGTGAVLAVSLVEAACKILSEMATFTEAGVSDRES
ncbi:MAG: nicotinate-nucleotide--dimethylbenzimidazole phosphoribosyltransferase [Chloroflexota bacterium]